MQGRAPSVAADKSKADDPNETGASSVDYLHLFGYTAHDYMWKRMIDSAINYADSDERDTQNRSLNLMDDKKLSDEDLARVNKYLETPMASVERKPFKPLRLLLLLIVVVSSLSFLSIVLARMAGVE